MENLDMADLKRLLHAKTITLEEFVKHSGNLSKRIAQQPGLAVVSIACSTFLLLASARRHA